MDKLPAEVLCDVFLKALPSQREGDESPKALTRTQLYISHVCRRWRDLSLSFGELWSYLQLNLGRTYAGDDAGDKWKSRNKIFDTWLLRSKGTPLNYMLYGTFTSDRYPHRVTDEQRQRDAERIIVALLAEQHRWKHIRIDFCNLTASADFPGFVLTNMPLLISLELSVPFRLLKMAPVSTSLAQSPRFPRLKRLIVNGQFDVDSGNVPTHTITEAQRLYRRRHANAQMPQACLYFLRNAPFIIEFRAFLSLAVSHTVFNPLEGDRVLLSNLRVLELRSHSLFEIIDKLTLPSLESLQYGDVTHEIAVPILRSFLERSRPPLTRLHISNGNADALIPCLGLLPALEFLQLQGMTVSERFFLALVVPDDVGVQDFDRILCPSLADLDLLFLRPQGNKEACIGAIFYMVVSRAEVLGTFKTIQRKFGPLSEPNKLAINDEDWSIDKLRALLEDSWTWTLAVRFFM